MLKAMARELEERAPASTMVRSPRSTSGGGPSLLEPRELEALLGIGRRLVHRGPGGGGDPGGQPDDITAGRLTAWRPGWHHPPEPGHAELSRGPAALHGRAHTAPDALRSIDLIAKAGFRSWTIDLIYGLPGMDRAEWDEQLTIALDHGMPHLSAYCLTVEPRTALAHQVANGTVVPATDTDTAAQFDRLMDRMEAAGFLH